MRELIATTTTPSGETYRDYQDGDLTNRVHSNGFQEWRDINQNLHRLDGPAVVRPSGVNIYYVNGLCQHKVLLFNEGIVRFFQSEVPTNYRLAQLPYEYNGYWGYTIHPDDITLFLLEFSDTMVIR